MTDVVSSMGGVEMDKLATRPNHQHIRHEPHRDLAYQRTSMQQSDINRQPAPSNAAHSPQMSTVQSNKTSNVQTTPQLTRANSDIQAHKIGSFSGPLSVPVSGPLNASISVGPTPSLDVSRRHSLHESRKTQQQQQYPRSPQDVGLDAIQRLQTQISQNSGALAAHTRDIRRGEESFGYLEETLRREFSSQIAFQNGELQRVDSAVAKLHDEMQGVRQAIEGLRHELHANRGERHLQHHPSAPPAQQISAQDSALELMAQQIAVISHKANEVDTLKITIEIMKNKIQRLEDGGRQPPTAGHNLPSQIHRGSASTQQSPQIPTHHSFPTPVATSTPEAAQHIERVPSQSSGWTTINSGAKRAHGVDVDNAYNGHAQISDSTKRPRLATESTSSFIQSTPQSHTMTADSQSHFVQHAQLLPSQPAFSGSIVSTQSQQPSHAPFGTQDAPSDDSWRPASQRDIEHRPRGRGRGGGPGSRGGRVRKSMPAQFHTPEWTREDWHGVPESPVGPDGLYNHAVRGAHGIARRGTGGGAGTRRGFTPTDRAVSMSVGPAIGFESPGEMYEHGKKTRTKPIRNADGVLIRKDGRPDMRSQSSAANLRKVHARREGESEFSPAGTPTHVHDRASANATETPSPSRGEALDSTNSKHNAIMGKMFPNGVDESRKEHDYTRELFDKDHDHTVHPRAQAPRLAAKQPSTVKKEQVDQPSMSEIQRRGNEVNVTTNVREEDAAGGEAEPVERGEESPASHPDDPDTRVIPETQMMDTT
ncbi:hypothetical protein NX059_004078 [Plenodomus lindquistii]|nr:hypothetical protein NX059_004078 [Plenodomus lindquistii]